MIRFSKSKSLNKSMNVAIQNCATSLFLSCIIIYFLPVCLREYLVHITGVLVFSTFLAHRLDDWRPRKKVNPNGKAVFITGCDSGFGHMLARDLDKADFQVFAGCLFPDGDGARELKMLSSPFLSVVSLDVTCDESINAAVEYVTRKLGDNELWAVVNNAGINDGGEIFWTNCDTIKKIFDVNTFGVVKVTKAFLPLLCKSEGRVVTVASAGAWFILPLMVPYCMSKSAAAVFCDGLRQEMHKFSVKVITIEPTFTKTAIVTNVPVMETWKKVSEDVKQLYSKNYAELLEIKFSKLHIIGVNNRAQVVVNSIKEAVTAETPKLCYKPGLWRTLIFIYIWNILPKPISDFLVESS